MAKGLQAEPRSSASSRWPIDCGRVQPSTVLGAERLQLGTAYPAVAARVAQLACWLYDRNSNGDHHVVADATSVGVTVGSPDDVGAVHQVLDGTMLDLDVSADFLRGMTVAGVIVDYEAAEGDMPMER